MEAARPGLRVVRWLRVIDQISIDIVFHDETGGIEPIARELISSYPLSFPPIRFAPSNLRDDLNWVSRRHILYVPVVENLTPQHMPSDAPAVLVPLFP